MVWVGIILLVLVFIVFVNAVEKVKYGEFDDTSWLLVSLGVFQWGQALVLTAFWMMYAIGCMVWWSPQKAMQVYILFHIVRAFVELFLLQNPEYKGLSLYIAPNSKKIKPHERMQLYILCQGLIIIGGVVLLLPNIFI